METRRFPSSMRSGDGTWAIGFGALVAAAGAYVFQILGGRSLGPDRFGPIAALWTTGYLLHTVVMIPVEQLITRTVSLTGVGPLPMKTRREAALALILGSAAGVLLVAIGLKRFYESDLAFVGAMAVLMASRSVMTLGRGALAGKRRFGSYGLSLALESGILVVLGGVIVIAHGGSAWLGFALALAPLAILCVRPFGAPQSNGAEVPPGSTDSVLPLLVVAAALAQLVLAGGPLAVGAVGGSAVQVSVFFITFTLLRGPVTASYGLSTRFLADMAAAAGRRDTSELRSWSLRLLTVGTIAVLIAALAGYLIVPGLVGALYGSDFRPTALVAALGSGGVVAALALLFSSQILVALGRTRDLASGWLFALAVAGLVLARPGNDPVLRVALAFAAGEGSAFVAVSAATIWRTVRTRKLEPGGRPSSTDVS